MKDQMILRILTKLALPYILVYGFYVIAHGEISAGGGFQGGVVLATAFILYAIVFDGEAMRQILPRKATDYLCCVGVLLYVGTGLWPLLKGYSLLDYTALDPLDPGHGSTVGMLLMEYAVGITVAAVMITLYNEMTQEPDEGTNI